MALFLVNVRLLKFVESRETVFVSRLFMQKKIKQEKTIVGKNVVLRFLVVGVLFRFFFHLFRFFFRKQIDFCLGLWYNEKSSKRYFVVTLILL